MLKGHERQGYAVITENAADDGTITEAVAAGVLTSHVVSFTGSRGNSAVEEWAGDTLEDSEEDTTGDVKLELSQLSLKDEAALGGHTYDSTKDLMTESASDTAPFVRYAAIGLGRRGATKGAMTNYWRLLMYYKVKFGPADDTMQTKEKTSSFKNHSLTATLYPNAQGKMRDKQDFTTFEAALAAAKTFLNIATV